MAPALAQVHACVEGCLYAELAKELLACGFT